MEKLGPKVRVIQARVLRAHMVRITFENGVHRDEDLGLYMRGPIFKDIKSTQAAFEAMRIVRGVICWENGADIDPDVLYYRLEPAGAGAPLHSVKP
jgi:hypothetical protein